jgi:cytochrome c-type protein NapB
MRTHLTAVLAAAGLAALSACAGPRATAPTVPPVKSAAPVKDRDLGLSKTSVFEVPAPPAWKAEDSAPGEKTPPPPRLGTQIPPVVPHGIADLLPITRSSNGCVDCHQIPGPKKAGEPTPLPASHYVDYRNAPDKAGDKVAGARWVCTACHVARTDAPPLVVNRFRP